MAEPALRLCAEAGLNFEATDRALLVPCANAPVDLLLVRSDDVPEYVQDGVVDLGITGANLVVEGGVDVVTLAELGFARCTLQAAVPEDAPQTELTDLTVSASRPPIPPRRRKLVCAELGVEAELFARLGLGRGRAAPRSLGCDRRSRLRPDRRRARTACRLLGSLLESQAVLIAEPSCCRWRAGELVERMVLMVSASSLRGAAAT